jgi:hypothetical protein
MKLRTLALLAIPLLVVLALGVTIFLNSWLRGFLRGEEFRNLISQKTSSALRVQGEYEPLAWTGFSVYSPRFRGQGIPGSPLAFVQADQIRTTFLWREAFGGVWKLDGVSIGQIRLVLGREAADRLSMRPSPAADLQKPVEIPGWLPTRIDPGKISVDSATVEFGEGAVRGVRADLKQQGAGWEIESTGGQFVWPGMPENTLRQTRSRMTREGFFLTDATLLLRTGGQLTLNGEIPAQTGEVHLQVRWTDVPVQEIVRGHSSFTLEGNCSGEADIRVPRGAPPRMNGTFLLREGQLRNIPVLSLLGRFTGASRFDPLPLSELSGTFRQDESGVYVSELVMESKGLLRVEGTLDLLDDRTIRGDLVVGLTPATLQWLPGSRERVFRDTRDGYLWAPVKIGGTTDQPTEDLSARLARAMGEEVLSGGTQAVDDAADTAVEGVRGILNLLLPLQNP